MLVAVAASRLAYPFELDWVEGALLEQTLRVRAGVPLYVAPSTAYVPLIYAPLFNYAAAAMAALVGPGFAALRTVSALAAAATLVITGVYVTRETGRRSAGLIAAALYAAGQHLAESWLDVGRSDSLFLALLIAGAFVYRTRAQGRGAPIAAGGLWALAFLTKQSVPVVLAPLLVWLVVRERARGRLAVAAFAALSLIAVLWIDSANGGWFRYYAFIVPRKFPMDPALAGRFFLEMTPLLPAFALGAAGAWTRFRTDAGDVGFHVALAGGLAFSSWHLRLYRGAGENVLLAAVLAAALAGGLGWGWLASRAAAVRPGRPASRPPAGRAGRIASHTPAWSPGRIASSLALCVQLAVLLRNPLPDIPRREDRAAGEDLVRRLASSEGPVFVSYHPYLARRAGKPTNVHIVPLMDMVRMPRDSIQDGLWQAMKDSLRTRAWDVLVLDQRDWLLEEAQAAGYREIAGVFADPDVFWPVTGYQTRPEWVFAPEERLEADTTAARSDSLREAIEP